MLNTETAILVVIDVQGNLAQLMYDRDRFFDSLQRVIKGAQTLGLPIIVTEQIPEKLGPTIPDLAGLFSPFQPLSKTSFSCAGNQEFIKTLGDAGRKQVLLTGLETHVCVYQTAIDLLASGYEVHVVVDAVSSRLAENRVLGLERIRDAGGIMTSTEMALFEMLKVAEGSRFKKIIQIVK